MEDARARVWFAATAAVVVFGIVVSLALAPGNVESSFDQGWERVLNVFAFFTIQSNILVGLASALLAADPRRSSTGFAVLRLTGLVAIVITGVVYHVMLSEISQEHGWALWSDHALHTVSPIVTVVGWLLFGPRGLPSAGVVWRSLVFPIAWTIFTLIRGELVGFYPYPFIDVGAHGYAQVSLNCLVIAVLYVGLATGALVLDRRLGRRVHRAVELERS
ncbi:MAG: Pr6Pr family membrane protein [Candidatus Velamenicoccus archaeovorus]